MSITIALLPFLSSLVNKEYVMLHVELVLQHSEALCCTWNSSCNFRRHYVARGTRLATFGGIMLHVDLLLQLSKALCCTWISSCNFRRHYVARGSRLATFGGIMLHVDLVLQLSGALCCTWISSCNISTFSSVKVWMNIPPRNCKKIDCFIPIKVI